MVAASRPAGITRIRRGRGFEYRDASGGRITDDVELSRIRLLAIPPAWTDVWISASAGARLQATGTDDAGRTQYRYHQRWTDRSARHKYDRMLDLIDALPAARGSVTRDLRTAEPSRQAVLASGFRMIDSALLRIGSEQYAQEHGSIGLTTLRVSHAEVAWPVVALRFRGKSGVAWATEIDDHDLADMIAVLAARGRRAKLLAWRDGSRWRSVRPEEINADIRARTGGDFTAKDFRTAHATILAAEELARAGVQETDKDRKAVEREAVGVVAAALGNTPAVARASYVDPRLFREFRAGRVVDLRGGGSTQAQLRGLLARAGKR